MFGKYMNLRTKIDFFRVWQTWNLPHSAPAYFLVIFQYPFRNISQYFILNIFYFLHFVAEYTIAKIIGKISELVKMNIKICSLQWGQKRLFWDYFEIVLDVAVVISSCVATLGTVWLKISISSKMMSALPS